MNQRRAFISLLALGLILAGCSNGVTVSVDTNGANGKTVKVTTGQEGVRVDANGQTVSVTGNENSLNIKANDSEIDVTGTENGATITGNGNSVKATATNSNGNASAQVEVNGAKIDVNTGAGGTNVKLPGGGSIDVKY